MSRRTSMVAFAAVAALLLGAVLPALAQPCPEGFPEGSECGLGFQLPEGFTEETYESFFNNAENDGTVWPGLEKVETLEQSRKRLSSETTQRTSWTPGVIPTGVEVWWNNPDGDQIAAVRHQGPCGSCYFAATLTTMEMWANIIRRKQGQSGNIYLDFFNGVYCLHNLRGEVCSGGHPPSTIEMMYKAQQDNRFGVGGKFLIRTESPAETDSFPSRTSNGGTCRAQGDDERVPFLYRLDPWFESRQRSSQVEAERGYDNIYLTFTAAPFVPIVSPYSTDPEVYNRTVFSMMSALTYGPMTVLMDATACGFGSNLPRDHQPQECPASRVRVRNHAVVLVGFMWTGNIDTSHFIIQNSWGIYSGYKGHTRLRMGHFMLSWATLPLLRPRNSYINPALPQLPEDRAFAVRPGMFVTCPENAKFYNVFDDKIDYSPKFKSVWSTSRSIQPKAPESGDLLFLSGDPKSTAIPCAKEAFFPPMLNLGGDANNQVLLFLANATETKYYVALSQRFGDISVRQFILRLARPNSVTTVSGSGSIRVSIVRVNSTTWQNAPTYSFSYSTDLPFAGATKELAFSFPPSVGAEPLSNYAYLRIVVTQTAADTANNLPLVIPVSKGFFRIDETRTAQFRAASTPDVETDSTGTSDTVSTVIIVVVVIAAVILVTIGAAVIVCLARRRSGTTATSNRTSMRRSASFRRAASRSQLARSRAAGSTRPHGTSIRGGGNSSMRVTA